jgi:hypothetical protein
VTVNCPIDCEYLREARLHEKPAPLPNEYPNKDIRLTDEFLSSHEGLLMILSISLAAGCQAKPEVIDNDVREALEALIRTYRTIESGLVYEAKPVNPLAAFIYEKLQHSVADFQKRSEAAGSRAFRDAEILGVLVFLQRMEIHHNNGRPKGRAFISFLRGGFPAKQVEPVVQP